MALTSRELVHATLDFQDPPRAPRHLWSLPGTDEQAYWSVLEEFPDDAGFVKAHFREVPPSQGDPNSPGTYIDPWGCAFENLQHGIIGEVKRALIEDWDDVGHVRFPRELLSVDRDAVNRECAASELFLFAGDGPQPFERLQYLRTSEELYVDLIEMPNGLRRFMREIHGFHCEVMETWAKTDVDALRFNDDWGSQRGLLISPEVWRDLFKPWYLDFAQIAHSHGKKLFMHSDGDIREIYPDLVEIGIDAVNSQVSLMRPESLEPYAGKITFWGEVDRQRLLPFGTPEEVESEVREVYRHLWKNGGCFAQCELGLEAKIENVRQVYRTWEAVV